MPRIVWVTPVPPDHRTGGGHMRQAYLLDALSGHAEVHLIHSGELRDDRVRAEVAAVTAVDAASDDWSARGRVLRRGRDLWLAAASKPREVTAFAPVRRAMQPVVAQATVGADAVVVEYAGLGDLISARRDPRVPWVLTLHNVNSAMAAQEAAITPGTRQRWLYERDARAARSWERGIVGRFDRVVAVSDDDAAVLREPGATVVVVPNGVDLERLTPSTLPEGHRLVFTGALYTAPNRDGALWLVDDIFPRIRAAVPDASLAIVGADPPPAVRALAGRPGVEVHADVEAVEPYLAAARVALVPLRIGSGTRLKALEAMAAGRPVVGTTIGLAGLSLRNGRDVRMADDPSAFAAAVVDLLRNPAAAQQLAVAGRRLVEDRFAWPAVGAAFTEMVLGSIR